jgi:hypothetical protein
MGVVLTGRESYAAQDFVGIGVAQRREALIGGADVSAVGGAGVCEYVVNRYQLVGAGALVAIRTHRLK